MPCDRKLKPRQTISQRAAEIRAATERLSAALVAGRVQVKIGANGVPVFTGWDESSRDGLSDACAYRQIMATGTSLAKLAFEKAELMSGHRVNKQAIAQGVHSHDGGQTLHDHKG
jgi:hypothetical protein